MRSETRQIRRMSDGHVYAYDKYLAKEPGFEVISATGKVMPTVKRRVGAEAAGEAERIDDKRQAPTATVQAMMDEATKLGIELDPDLSAAEMRETIDELIRIEQEDAPEVKPEPEAEDDVAPESDAAPYEYLTDKDDLIAYGQSEFGVKLSRSCKVETLKKKLAAMNSNR